MDNIIKQCKDKYFELYPSKIHGIGIIALRTIPKILFYLNILNLQNIYYMMIYTKMEYKNL